MQRGAKVRKGADDALGVGSIGSNPNVEVLRRANEAVRGECVSADNEELNATRVERG